MATPDELSFSAKQAAARLALSPAMTRRYAAALEKITGEPIRQHPRDGRQYTRTQLETMLQAKALVESNARLSVEQALELASGKAETVATALVAQEPGALSGAQSGALVQELRALVATFERSAQNDAAMLAELQELRAEVAGLRDDVRRGPAELPPASTTDREATDAAAGGGGSDGLLVKVARRLERLFGR